VHAHTPIEKEVVLIGGGHTHALVLRHIGMNPIAGLRITLISPAAYTPYSGMLPGLIAGDYSFEEAHIDLARLCQWAGVRFLQAEVTAIDARAQRLQLAGRVDVDYDVVSIDIGSQPELASVPGAREFATPVKPVSAFWQRWKSVETLLSKATPANPLRISIVGGGAGSVELALAMAQRLQQYASQIDLWCGSPHILSSYNSGARRVVMSALQDVGVHVHLDARVADVSPTALRTTKGISDEFDILFWCTGASAAPLIASSGLKTDDAGFLCVRDTLQSLEFDNVFAAGDIAVQINHPRPKAGVFAVRQAPVLSHNLHAFVLSQRLREHHPQSRFLSLLSLGNRSAVAEKGRFSASGKWVWRWKNHIDKTFMERFSQLSSSMNRVPAKYLAGHDDESQMACGGCGAKVGATPLRQVLAQLHREFPRHTTSEGDDAVVIELPTTQVAAPTLLQTVDVLREIVADPWLMGRIAANHALSDLYASGAQPLSVLAAVTLPFCSPDIQQRELYQLLAGALEEFVETDCVLSGGHSMQGPELSLGFTATGLAADDIMTARRFNKRGANTGDAIILTKPLGTGVLFAAQMQLLAKGTDIETAVQSMLRSNRFAAKTARDHGVTACTDVTGFGLLGHLHEMLERNQSAHLSLQKIHLLPGVPALLKAGIRSTMHEANSASVEGEVRINGKVDENAIHGLYDPQTSGGLLFTIPQQDAPALRDALIANGDTHAAIIGEIHSAGETLESNARFVLF